jgi:hypothetical protein
MCINKLNPREESELEKITNEMKREKEKIRM